MVTSQANFRIRSKRQNRKWKKKLTSSFQSIPACKTACLLERRLIISEDLEIKLLFRFLLTETFYKAKIENIKDAAGLFFDKLFAILRTTEVATLQENLFNFILHNIFLNAKCSLCWILLWADGGCRVHRHSLLLRDRLIKWLLFYWAFQGFLLLDFFTSFLSFNHDFLLSRLFFVRNSFLLLSMLFFQLSGFLSGSFSWFGFPSISDFRYFHRDTRRDTLLDIHVGSC